MKNKILGTDELRQVVSRLKKKEKGSSDKWML